MFWGFCVVVAAVYAYFIFLGIIEWIMEVFEKLTRKGKKDENPSHLEDFEALLTDASTPVEEDDQT